MIYKISYNKKVKKFIEKQAKDQRLRIYEAINKLPDGDVKRMQTKQELYRLRVGEFCFVYEIIHDEIIISVIDADNRGDIYKKYK